MQLVQLIFAILAAILTYALIPWIRSKKTAEERAALAESIRTAVYAAEQTFNAGEGRKKKAYVLQWLREQGVVIDEVEITQLVDALIESTVLELKKEG